jgi:pimeloyl-ACP methyl ester carboxylesterase
MAMSQSRFFVPDKFRFHVMDWGGESNPPLIFLHGLASSCHMFDLIAPHYTDRFHVYAPDQRGHGLSDKPTSGYDFETIAQDLDNLLTALGISQPIVLIGHSWGAYTTLYYAATRPQRVSKVALLDGGTQRIADEYPTWAEAEIGMAPPVYKNRSLDDIQRMIQTEWLAPFFRPELMPLALPIFDTSNPKDVKARLSRENHMQIARALWDFEPAAYYSLVACPTLIVNAVAPGSLISAEAEAYANRARQGIGRCRVVWMNDTAHDIPWHNPSGLNVVLDFFLRSP